MSISMRNLESEKRKALPPDVIYYESGLEGPFRDFDGSRNDFLQPLSCVWFDSIEQQKEKVDAYEAEYARTGSELVIVRGQPMTSGTADNMRQFIAVHEEGLSLLSCSFAELSNRSNDFRFGSGCSAADVSTAEHVCSCNFALEYRTFLLECGWMFVFDIPVCGIGSIEGVCDLTRWLRAVSGMPLSYYGLLRYYDSNCEKSYVIQDVGGSVYILRWRKDAGWDVSSGFVSMRDLIMHLWYLKKMGIYYGGK